MTQNLSPDVAARLEEFLEPVRIVVVATIGRDGMPQLTPNWYWYSDGKIKISTTMERVKYRNLVRDSRMSVCIYSEPRAQDYVAIRGPVEIIEGDAIWPDTQEIIKRYVPAERFDEMIDQLRSQNRVILSLTPERVAFRS